jgi:2-phospho-L-lactate guanylyltransferase
LLADMPHLSNVLVLPIDLPDATPDALAAMLASPADVTIAPDRDRQGTNALRLRGRAVPEFPFSFGPGSFARHGAAAASMNLTRQVIADPRLAFDVDQVAHYEEWSARTRLPQRTS